MNQASTCMSRRYTPTQHVTTLTLVSGLPNNAKPACTTKTTLPASQTSTGMIVEQNDCWPKHTLRNLDPSIQFPNGRYHKKSPPTTFPAPLHHRFNFPLCFPAVPAAPRTQDPPLSGSREVEPWFAKYVATRLTRRGVVVGLGVL